MHEKGAEQTVPSNWEEQQSTHDLVYDNADEEPELHFRTYIAIAAMFLLNLTQVFALQGPPVVVRDRTPWASRHTETIKQST